MQLQIKHKESKEQVHHLGSFYRQRVDLYLQGLLKELDKLLDKRLVNTFKQLFLSILSFRNRSFGLVLSELGGYLLGIERCAAGTKRISNLLRSVKWDVSVVERFWLGRAHQRLKQIRDAGHQALLIWDDSVVEKSESWYSEGLCPVPSSKGKRMLRIKPGYYKAPASRFCVPGFHWTGVLMATLKEKPSLVLMRWWTTRGKHINDGRSVFLQMLKRIVEQLGCQSVIHVLDRGYASAWVLEYLVKYRQHFLIRWIKTHHFIDPQGKTRALSRFFTAKQARSSRWMSIRGKKQRMVLFFSSLRHPDFPHLPLSLVACRAKKPQSEFFFLLTSADVQTPAQAWNICFAYLKRWNIEQAFRFLKSELALESARIRFWNNRLKLMAIVASVYDFMLFILRIWQPIIAITFKDYCPRSHPKLKRANLPIYRLRIALAYILTEFAILLKFNPNPPPKFI